MNRSREWKEEVWIRNFFVVPEDPGFIYIIENDGKYKIGRSIQPNKRIQSFKTCLPDLKVIGIKPFWSHKEKERLLHIGYARCWYNREWFEPIDEGYYEVLIDEFVAFSDTDINHNSVDFVYWYAGSGMIEFALEQDRQKLSSRKFQRQETEWHQLNLDLD